MHQADARRRPQCWPQALARACRGAGRGQPRSEPSTTSACSFAQRLSRAGRRSSAVLVSPPLASLPNLDREARRAVRPAASKDFTKAGAKRFLAGRLRERAHQSEGRPPRCVAPEEAVRRPRGRETGSPGTKPKLTARTGSRRASACARTQQRRRSRPATRSQDEVAERSPPQERETDPRAASPRRGRHFGDRATSALPRQALADFCERAAVEPIARQLLERGRLNRRAERQVGFGPASKRSSLQARRRPTKVGRAARDPAVSSLRSEARPPDRRRARRRNETSRRRRQAAGSRSVEEADAEASGRGTALRTKLA